MTMIRTFFLVRDFDPKYLARNNLFKQKTTKDWWGLIQVYHITVVLVNNNITWINISLRKGLVWISYDIASATQFQELTQTRIRLSNYSGEN